MPQSPSAEKKKKSLLAEIFSWIFDLAIVALLIWYFANPANQTSFWQTLRQLYSKGSKTVFAFLATKKEESSKQTAKDSAEKTSRKAEADSSPAPPEFIPPPLPTETELESQVPGDCFPPELRSLEDAETPEIARIFYQPEPLPKQLKTRKGKGKPVKFEKKTIKGVPLYLSTIDLNDPDTFIVLRLPKNAEQANSTTYSAGHDNFETFVKKYPAAIVVNGTFFSKDEQERVMGNMVSEGKMLKYSQWENYGTTLSLREGDYPEMVTARAEGKPNWNEHWFSLTCGPRLIKQGEVWVNPELEGFADPHVLGCGSRAAIGFNKDRNKLYLVTFLRGLALKDEARLMKELGCYEAMNLDGGASKALSQNGKIIMKPGRGLTNVLVIYDNTHKAPPQILSAWQQFQEKKSN